MNPTAAAAMTRVRRSLEDLRRTVRGMDPESLNWQPAPHTNSIAAQVAHVLRSADFNLGSAAAGSGDLQGYLKVREDAFHFGADEHALRQMLDNFESRLPGLFERIDEERLATVLDWPDWGNPTVASCVLGVVEHAREHVGAAALTRQLWELRQQR